MKLEFSRQILDKSSNTEVDENPSSGSRVFLRGQTDGRTYIKTANWIANASKKKKGTRNKTSVLDVKFDYEFSLMFWGYAG